MADKPDQGGTMDANSLAGKRALITGGSSGIGLAVARGFLERGARVAITGRAAAKLSRAVQTLAGGDRLIAAPADAADSHQIAEAVARVVDRWHSLDILVTTAGLNIKERATRDLTPEKWQQLIRTNLDGAFYAIHAVLPYMVRQKDGLIVNVCSVAGLRAIPLSGAGYSASKFGMHALGLCLAAEEKDNGIRVSNIYPGEVDTPILEARPEPLTAEHRQRILQPEDVAAAVLYVASLPARVSVPELIIKPASQVFL
jgi:NADP-dependent 3-hydroxy acid dehydrogenase YdfG